MTDRRLGISEQLKMMSEILSQQDDTSLSPSLDAPDFEIVLCEFASMVANTELIRHPHFAKFGTILADLAERNLGTDTAGTSQTGGRPGMQEEMSPEPPYPPATSVPDPATAAAAASAIENAPFGLQITDADNGVVYANEAVRRQFPGAAKDSIWRGAEPCLQEIRYPERHPGADLLVEFNMDHGHDPDRYKLERARHPTSVNPLSFRIFRFVRHRLPDSDLTATWLMEATRAETDRQQFAQSLDAAFGLQQAIFHTTRPKEVMPDFHHATLQKQVTGGDFIFARTLSPARSLLVVGDCFGKGVLAALVTAIVGMSLQRWYLSRDRNSTTPADLLRRIDRDIQEFLYREDTDDDADGAGDEDDGASDDTERARPRPNVPSASEPEPLETGLDALAMIIDRKHGTIEYATAGNSVVGYLLRKREPHLTRLGDGVSAAVAHEAKPRLPGDKGIGTRRAAGDEIEIKPDSCNGLENGDKIIVFTDGLEVQPGPAGATHPAAYGRVRIEEKVARAHQIRATQTPHPAPRGLGRPSWPREQPERRYGSCSCEVPHRREEIR